MWKLTFKSPVWLVTSIAISCSMISFAVPISSLNLESLCDSSDLIIVGGVGHFAKIDEVPVKVGQNTLNADLMESPVEVMSVLKGAEAPRYILVQVTVMRPSWGSGQPRRDSRRRRKAVIPQKPRGRPISGYRPLPSLPARASPSDLAGTPLDRVANVECQVIASKSNPVSDKLDAMRASAAYFPLA